MCRRQAKLVPPGQGHQGQLLKLFGLIIPFLALYKTTRHLPRFLGAQLQLCLLTNQLLVATKDSGQG